MKTLLTYVKKYRRPLFLVVGVVLLFYFLTMTLPMTREGLKSKPSKSTKKSNNKKINKPAKKLGKNKKPRKKQQQQAQPDVVIKSDFPTESEYRRDQLSYEPYNFVNLMQVTPATVSIGTDFVPIGDGSSISIISPSPKSQK